MGGVRARGYPEARRLTPFPWRLDGSAARRLCSSAALRLTPQRVVGSVARLLSRACVSSSSASMCERRSSSAPVARSFYSTQACVRRSRAPHGASPSSTSLPGQVRHGTRDGGAATSRHPSMPVNSKGHRTAGTARPSATGQGSRCTGAHCTVARLCASSHASPRCAGRASASYFRRKIVAYFRKIVAYFSKCMANFC